jgi:hypothetical protein
MFLSALKTCSLHTARILSFICLGCYQPVAFASGDEGLQVYSASTYPQGGMYYLDAQLDYGLSRAALDALDSGVPLIFELEVEIYTPRKWFWDKTLADYNYRYQVLYHALTQQYIVTNINSGIQNSYSRRNTALLSMGRIHNLPLLEKKKIPEGEKYLGRVRVSLDIGALPAPMRPWAYINTDWLLASEWFTWEIN